MEEDSEVYLAMSVDRAKALFGLIAEAAHAGLHKQHLSTELTLTLLSVAADLVTAIEIAEKGGGADPRMN